MDTLAQRVKVLESVFMSKAMKAWYFTQLLPLAKEAAAPPPPCNPGHQMAHFL